MRHVVLGFTGAGLVAAISAGTDGATMFRLSMGSAYAALAFLAATLLIGPLNLLRSKANPVSTDLRRDLGIGAAVLAIFHTVVGLQVHLQG